MKPSARYDAADSALVASGDWQADAATALPDLGTKPVRVLDGSGLTRLDTNGAWLLLAAARPVHDSPMPLLRGFSADHDALMAQVVRHWATTAPRPPLPCEGVRMQTGRGAVAAAHHVTGLLNFVGQLTLESLALARNPGQWRWRELAAQIRDIFVGAIPLVAGMMFLLGVVFAYLLGTQAQRYGANIFVVDGLLAAILREISPLIVAILVAGRSGAAIAAQLGAMKITEEIDAISTLGLSPYAVLVIPRLLALLLAMPLLVFIGDIAGMLGGMIVAEQQLGISPHMFMDRTEDVLLLKTLLVGLFKAPVFAIFIALIACRMGLAVTRDSRSVGANTTSTVVQSLVAIILLNAMFVVAFVNLGI